MRRATAVALSVTAFCAAALTAAGPAEAATGHSVGGQVGAAHSSDNARSTSSTPKPIGAKHYFYVGGTAGGHSSGNWFYSNVLIKGKTKKMVIVDFRVYDTKADGKSAGVCFYYTSKYNQPAQNLCEVNLAGAGKSLHIQWWIYPSDHLSMYSAVGVLDKVHHIFNTTENGRLVKIR